MIINNTISKLKNTLSLSSGLGKVRLFTLLIFLIMVVAVAWQSDDAYHGYVMAKHLAEGDGFVYNAGERSTASTCPLFTLIIALAYAVTREMYFTSIAVCALFSTAAYAIFAYRICRTTNQVLMGFILMMGSAAFMSYTTSGLENSLLFFLSALFASIIQKDEGKVSGADMFRLALIVSATAMARMDSALIFAPVMLYIYLKDRQVSFLKAAGLGIAGLSPFFLYELFALFYFGFPFPNPAYVKLGSGIALSEYLQRGFLYVIYTSLVDCVVVVVPLLTAAVAFFTKRAKYIFTALGICLYFAYIVRIGGDFMMGRHFTNIFFLSVCLAVICMNHPDSTAKGGAAVRQLFIMGAAASVIVSATFGRSVGSQYLAGHKYSSQISDEREYYFSTTGLYNNLVSLFKNGSICVQDTWNNMATDDIRSNGLPGGIIENAAGILVYYNSDLYLNDTYALGDPFLSKLPAKYDPNWRVGHLRRELPRGYRTSIYIGENSIKDDDLYQYYEVIRKITRGDLFDSERLRYIIDFNMGRYDYLKENYLRRKSAGEDV